MICDEFITLQSRPFSLKTMHISPLISLIKVKNFLNSFAHSIVTESSMSFIIGYNSVRLVYVDVIMFFILCIFPLLTTVHGIGSGISYPLNETTKSEITLIWNSISLASSELDSIPYIPLNFIAQVDPTDENTGYVTRYIDRVVKYDVNTVSSKEVDKKMCDEIAYKQCQSDFSLACNCRSVLEQVVEIRFRIDYRVDGEGIDSLYAIDPPTFHDDVLSYSIVEDINYLSVDLSFYRDDYPNIQNDLRDLNQHLVDYKPPLMKLDLCDDVVCLNEGYCDNETGFCVCRFGTHIIDNSFCQFSTREQADYVLDYNHEFDVIEKSQCRMGPGEKPTLVTLTNQQGELHWQSVVDVVASHPDIFVGVQNTSETAYALYTGVGTPPQIPDVTYQSVESFGITGKFISPIDTVTAFDDNSNCLIYNQYFDKHPSGIIDVTSSYTTLISRCWMDCVNDINCNGFVYAGGQCSLLQNIDNCYTKSNDDASLFLLAADISDCPTANVTTLPPSLTPPPTRRPTLRPTARPTFRATVGRDTFEERLGIGNIPPFSVIAPNATSLNECRHACLDDEFLCHGYVYDTVVTQCRKYRFEFTAAMINGVECLNSGGIIMGRRNLPGTLTEITCTEE